MLIPLFYSDLVNMFSSWHTTSRPSIDITMGIEDKEFFPFLDVRVFRDAIISSQHQFIEKTPSREYSPPKPHSCPKHTKRDLSPHCYTVPKSSTPRSLSYMTKSNTERYLSQKWIPAIFAVFSGSLIKSTGTYCT